MELHRNAVKLYCWLGQPCEFSSDQQEKLTLQALIWVLQWEQRSDSLLNSSVKQQPIRNSSYSRGGHCRGSCQGHFCIIYRVLLQISHKDSLMPQAPSPSAVAFGTSQCLHSPLQLNRRIFVPDESSLLCGLTWHLKCATILVCKQCFSFFSSMFFCHFATIVIGL